MISLLGQPTVGLRCWMLDMDRGVILTNIQAFHLYLTIAVYVVTIWWTKER